MKANIAISLEVIIGIRSALWILSEITFGSEVSTNPSSESDRFSSRAVRKSLLPSPRGSGFVSLHSGQGQGWKLSGSPNPGKAGATGVSVDMTNAFSVRLQDLYFTIDVLGVGWMQGHYSRIKTRHKPWRALFSGLSALIGFSDSTGENSLQALNPFVIRIFRISSSQRRCPAITWQKGPDRVLKSQEASIIVSSSTCIAEIPKSVKNASSLFGNGENNCFSPSLF